MKEKHSKFWWVTHIATWAMLIVTILGAVVVALSAMNVF
ncbi:DUF4044 domain-containing protein [Lacticaseibacillus jixianensis]|uniref:DUF4044 domain-containing protein n=1 Tax=Lacticaseibacillus jixianensis TaxID=2486012 RepID=A0ABW4B7I3_9LACO